MSTRRHRRPAPPAPRRRAPLAARPATTSSTSTPAHALSTLQHFLSPPLQPPRRRLRRHAREPRAAAARGARGHASRSATAAPRWPAGIVVDELLGADGIERGEIEELLGAGRRAARPLGLHGRRLGGRLASRRGSATRRGPGAYVRGLKALTSKPVVGVGRLTSPDTMVRLVRDGVLDLIGAARPSIADPFLPRKIEEGRLEDIRECIGCNVCVTGDWTMTPIRCTQNPSMGEEWRRGWHPERIRPQGSDARVLVVGGGPAGLEAAMALGKRGYEVVLAEATRELGGRVLARGAAARASRPGSASSTTAACSCARLAERRAGARERGDGRRGARVRLRPRRRGHRRALARATASGAGTRAPSRSDRRRRAHPGRPVRRRAPERRARRPVRRRPLLPRRRPRRAAGRARAAPSRW